MCNSVTSVKTQQKSQLHEPTGLSSHTYVLPVIGHGRKFLHHAFEFLTISAAEHQLAASCMESFGTLFGGSKEERKVNIGTPETNGRCTSYL